MLSATALRAILSGTDRSLPARLLLLLLRPFSYLFGLVICLRNWLFDRGLRAIFRAAVPVVSVGNLTAGGTGKTPAVDYLVKSLQRQGRRVAIVSRGYGGTLRLPAAYVSDGHTLLLSVAEAGDEPLLLARRNPLVPVVIARRRAEGIRLLQRTLTIDCIVLDDAFQHRQVHRDLDIVLLDAQRPFGNGLLQPAGLLRETATALRRADLVIMTRMADGITLPILDAHILCSRHVLDRSGVSLNGERIDFADLTGKRVFAFAGIAEPESFFAGLRSAGVELCGCLGFPDHAVYDKPQLELLLSTAAAADIFLTTEKDAVKLDSADFDQPCYSVGVSFEFEDDFFLQRRLDQLWPKRL